MLENRSKKVKTIVVVIMILFVILVGLVTNKYLYSTRYNNNVKVKNVKVETLKSENEEEIEKNEVSKEEEKQTNEEVSSEEIKEDTTNGYDTIYYDIKYKLETEDKKEVDGRVAVVTATLSDEEAKYASFNNVEEENIKSEIIDNGKTLKLTISNVTTNKEYTVKAKINIVGAPADYKISPKITVLENTSENLKMVTYASSSVVNTRSISGKVINKETNSVENDVELEICKVNNGVCEDKKSVYTKEDGSYVFTDLSEGNYQIKIVNESKYALIKEIEEITTIEGNIEYNIEVINQGEFKASIKKYVRKVIVEENENSKTYDYDKLDKALVAVKNIKNANIKIIYEFEIKNETSKEGYVKVIKENIPKGLEFDPNIEENNGWEEIEGKLYNKTLANTVINAKETKIVTIALKTKDTDTAKNYLNKVSITGENYYTVKYVVNDEVVKELSIIDSDRVDNYNYEKDGYKLDGWYIDKEYTKEYDFNTPVEDDLILYGKVENTMCNFTYLRKDGTVFKNTQIKCGETADDIEGPTDEYGYDFECWLDQEKEETCFDFDKKIEEDTTVIADMKKHIFSVEFIDLGKQYGEIQKVKYKEKATKPEDPSHDDKEFMGWTLNGEVYDFDTPVESDITLVSSYNDNYDVIFIDEKKDDESKVYNTILNVKPGTTITKPEDPTHTGYTFTGWYESDEIQAFDFENSTMPNSNLTLYAHYDINKQKVEFKDTKENCTTPDCKYEDIPDVTVDYGETVDEPTKIPEKECLEFKYWSIYESGLDEDGNEAPFNFLMTKIYKDEVLYAIFDTKEVEVTYLDKGSKIDTENSLIACGTKINTEEICEEEGNCEKDGYEFECFMDVENEGECLDPNTEITKDITLTTSYIKLPTPVISHTPTEWTKNNVTVSMNYPTDSKIVRSVTNIVTDESGLITYEEKETNTEENLLLTSDKYDLNYQVVSEKDINDETSEFEEYTLSNYWDQYTDAFILEKNAIVVGKVTVKDTSESSVNLEHEVLNIDKKSPVINKFTSSNVTSNSFDLNINTVDLQSGTHYIRIYKNGDLIYTETYDSDYNTEKVLKYPVSEGIEELTTYTVRIEVEDIATNITQSEDMDVTTLEDKKVVIAQIIGRSNALYENETLYEPFYSLESAVEACGNNQCTIQMVNDTIESVEINETQDITLDINGKIISGENTNTITNYGKFIVIDNGEVAGLITNTKEDGVAINSVNTSELTLGIDDEEAPSVTTPNIVGTSYGIVIGDDSTFNFYDGRVEGNIAVKGIVDRHPEDYMPNIETDVTQVATLQIVADAVARINFTTYTELESALGESVSGSYEEVNQTGTLMKTATKSNDYGFYYDKTSNKLFSENVGIANSTANAYVKIDLSDYTNDQILIVNAEISSEKYNDVGYATITESEVVPEYSNLNGQFLSISGEIDSTDYEYTLKPGKVYYLHLGYYKNGSTNTGNDIFIINSIKLQNLELSEGNSVVKQGEYGFVQDSKNRLISTNTGIHSSISTSYIKVDLTNETEDRAIIVNAEIGSESGDVGYVTISNSEDIPEYSSSLPIAEKILQISGKKEASDYSSSYVRLKAGQINYIHLGYRKNDWGSSYTDTFTINSITYEDGTSVYALYSPGEKSEKSNQENIISTPKLNEKADTIVLLKNISLSNNLEIEPIKDVTLDLNGKKLTTDLSNYVIRNKGSLKIIDSKYSKNAENAYNTYKYEQAEYDEEYKKELEIYNPYKNEIEQQYANECEQYDGVIQEENILTIEAEDTNIVSGNVGNDGSFSNGKRLYNAYDFNFDFEITTQIITDTYLNIYGTYLNNQSMIYLDGVLIYTSFDETSSAYTTINLNLGKLEEGSHNIRFKRFGSNSTPTYDYFEVVQSAYSCKTYNDINTIELTTSNFAYDSITENSSDGFSVNTNGIISSKAYAAGNKSELHYNKKIVVPEGQTFTARGTIGFSKSSTSSSGIGYVGFSSTNEIRSDDFIEYISKEITSKNTSYEEFEIKIDKPGEYYFKILLDNNNETGYYTIYSDLKNLEFTLAPKLKQAELATTAHNGVIKSTTGVAIYNDYGSYLQIDEALIESTKTGIVNYGTVKLNKDALINNSSSSSVGILNEKSGTILDSEGTINVTTASSYGIKNYSLLNNTIKGININLSDNSSYGIMHSSNYELNVRNTNIDGSGIAIYNYLSGVVNLYDNNIYGYKGLYQYNYQTNMFGVINVYSGITEGTQYAIENEGGRININDGEFYGKLYNSGTLSRAVVMNIKNGHINGTISNSSTYSELNIENGTIELLGGPLYNNGSAIISGGTIIGNNYSSNSVNRVLENTGNLEVSGGNIIYPEDSFNKETSVELDGIYNQNGNIKILGGNIKSPTNGIVNTSLSNNIATADIIGGTIEGSDSGIYNTSGIVNIGLKVKPDDIVSYTDENGNTIYDDSVSTTYPKIKSDKYGINNGSTLNWYDGVVIGEKNNGISGRITDSEENYDILIKEENETLENITLAIPTIEEFGEVVRIGETTYPSLQSAMNAIPTYNETDESTIKTMVLLKDIRTISSNNMQESKNGVFDINGNIVKSYSSSSLIENNGELTIIDSTSTTNDDGYLSNTTGALIAIGQLITNSGTLKFNSGVLEGSSEKFSNFSALSNINNGLLIMNDGKINPSVIAINNESTNKVEINGGNISGEIRSNVGTIEINQGKISNTINISEIGTLTINDGLIVPSSSSEFAINNKSTNRVVINGGTIGSVHNGNTSSDYSVLTITGGNIKQIGNGYGITNIEDGEIEKLYNSESNIINVLEGKVGLVENDKTGMINIIGGEVGQVTNFKTGIINIGLKIKPNDVESYTDENGNTIYDDSLNIESPKIVSTNDYGLIIKAGTVNFYDGVIKGKSGTEAISGSITEIETGYDLVHENSVTETSEDGTVNILDIAYLGHNPIVKNLTTSAEYVDLQEAIDNAINGDTLQIINSFQVFQADDSITIPSSKNIVLDINGKTITNDKDSYINNEGVLKIIDSQNTIDDSGLISKDGGGKIVSSADTLLVNSETGSIELAGATIETSSTFIKNYNEITITSGLISSPKVIDDYSSSEIIINGGKITGFSNAIETIYGKIKIKGGVILNNDNKSGCVVHINENVTENESASVNISGGELVASLYNDGTNTISITSGTFIVGYAGIINNNSGEINIENVQVKSSIYNNGDGTINITESTTGDINNSGEGLIETKNSDTSSITNDSTGNVNIIGGTIKCTKATPYTLYVNGSSSSGSILYGILNNSTGTININDVTINGTGIIIKNSGEGTINILKGTFITDGTSTDKTKLTNAICNSSTGIINIGTEDSINTTDDILISSALAYGVYNESNGTINFYDGLIKGKEGAIYGKVSNIESGYSILTDRKDTTEDELEHKYLGKQDVAEIISTGMTYSSLQEAIDAVTTDGETIKILRNYDILSTESAINIPSDKNISLDVNGKLISVSNELFIQNNGKLKIIDNKNIIDDTGIITTDGGGIIKIYYGCIVDNLGDLEIDGASLYQNIESNSSETTQVLLKNSGKGKIIVTSGKLDLDIGNISNDVIVTAIAIDNISTGDIDVKGGTILVNNSSAYVSKVYVINNQLTGNVTISGGDISGTAKSYAEKYPHSYSFVLYNWSTGNVVISGGNISSFASSSHSSKNGTSYSDSYAIYNSSTGKMDISGGNISSNSISDETLNVGVYNAKADVTISGGNINVLSSDNGLVEIINCEIENLKNYEGIVNIKNGTINNVRNIYGTINIIGGSINSVLNSGTTNITGGTISNSNGYGVQNTGTGTINIGTDDNLVDIESPSITGSTYGVINADSSGIINFYDGIIIGPIGNSYSGVLTTLSDYKIDTVTNEETGTESSTLSKKATVKDVISYNGFNYQTLQSAVNAATGTTADMTLKDNYILESDVIIPADTIINFYLNGHTITYNDYTISGEGTFNIMDAEESSNLLGAISDIFNNNKLTKNIIVYEMNDGSNLDPLKTYELKIYNDGKYENVNMEYEVNNAGRYSLNNKSKNDKMTTINGKLFLNNLVTGDYKLVDSNGGELLFTISEDGKLTGNIKENYTKNFNKIMSTAYAELVVSIQTGQKIIKYGLIIFTISLTLVLLLIMRKNMNKGKSY